MINIKNISMIGLVLLLIGIIGVVFTFSSKGQGEEVFEEKIIADDFINIDLRTDNNLIEILPTDEKNAKIEFSGFSSNKYQFSADVNKSTLSVELTQRQNGFIHFNFFSNRLTLTIFVPEKQYDSIKAKSNNGQVNVEQLLAKELKLETDNGRIAVDGFEGTTVVAQSSNGRIKLENIDATSVDVSVSNGKIELENVAGTLNGKTSNGSITLVTDTLDRAIDFQTSNGKINIQSKTEPTNAFIDVNVDNGRVNIFGDSDRSVKFGNGENLVKLTTNNGRISVTN